MKRYDALIARQKTSALCKVLSRKKSVKTAKKNIIKKMPVFSGFSLQRDEVVLRCNQCIKMPHLRYQKTLLDGFHFCHIMGGPIVQTPGRGGKNWYIFLKILSFLIYKTTFKNTWGLNVSPLLRKTKVLGPPPLVLAVLYCKWTVPHYGGFDAQ